MVIQKIELFSTPLTPDYRNVYDDYNSSTDYVNFLKENFLYEVFNRPTDSSRKEKNGELDIVLHGLHTDAVRLHDYNYVAIYTTHGGQGDVIKFAFVIDMESVNDTVEVGQNGSIRIHVKMDSWANHYLNIKYAYNSIVENRCTFDTKTNPFVLTGVSNKNFKYEKKPVKMLGSALNDYYAVLWQRIVVTTPCYLTDVTGDTPLPVDDLCSNANNDEGGYPFYRIAGILHWYYDTTAKAPKFEFMRNGVQLNLPMEIGGQEVLVVGACEVNYNTLRSNPVYTNPVSTDFVLSNTLTFQVPFSYTIAYSSTVGGFVVNAITSDSQNAFSAIFKTGRKITHKGVTYPSGAGTNLSVDELTNAVRAQSVSESGISLETIIKNPKLENNFDIAITNQVNNKFIFVQSYSSRVDVDRENKLYYSIPIYDYNKRYSVNLTDAIENEAISMYYPFKYYSILANGKNIDLISGELESGTITIYSNIDGKITRQITAQSESNGISFYEVLKTNGNLFCISERIDQYLAQNANRILQAQKQSLDMFLSGAILRAPVPTDVASIAGVFLREDAYQADLANSEPRVSASAENPVQNPYFLDGAFVFENTVNDMQAKSLIENFHKEGYTVNILDNISNKRRDVFDVDCGVADIACPMSKDDKEELLSAFSRGVTRWHIGENNADRKLILKAMNKNVVNYPISLIP